LLDLLVDLRLFHEGLVDLGQIIESTVGLFGGIAKKLERDRFSIDARRDLKKSIVALML
jgi:hypothetical protein